jgi:hypothetical protein
MGIAQGVRPALVKVGIRPFHALFERCQHACGPYRPFHPRPAVPYASGGRGVSVLRSRCRHWRRPRFALVRFAMVHVVPHASISLRPFAPPELPGLDATRNALTPGRRHARNRARDHAFPTRPGLPASCFGPSDRSVSNHPLPSPEARFGFLLCDLEVVSKPSDGQIRVDPLLTFSCRQPGFETATPVEPGSPPRRPETLTSALRRTFSPSPSHRRTGSPSYKTGHFRRFPRIRLDFRTTPSSPREAYVQGPDVTNCAEERCDNP